MICPHQYSQPFYQFISCYTLLNLLFCILYLFIVLFYLVSFDSHTFKNFFRCDFLQLFGIFKTADLKSLSNAAGVTQLVGVLPCKPKDCVFNSQSGHIPGLWVQLLVGACARGSQLMFLSLPSPFSKINEHVLR